MKMRRVLVLLAVLCVCDGLKFGQLCHGNSANTIRTSDNWGQGHYGANRENNKKHKGVDIVCSDGSIVYAPFDATIDRGLIVYPHTRHEPINKGLQLSGEGLCIMLFYVEPDQVSGSVTKGERIGVMMPMQTVWSGMTSHVHVQKCDKSDPTPYL